MGQAHDYVKVAFDLIDDLDRLTAVRQRDESCFDDLGRLWLHVVFNNGRA